MPNLMSEQSTVSSFAAVTNKIRIQTTGIINDDNEVIDDFKIITEIRNVTLEIIKSTKAQITSRASRTVNTKREHQSILIQMQLSLLANKRFTERTIG